MRVRLLLAFAVIYFVWGSTFLAIRIGVHEVPPLLFAAMRFFTAGALVTGWMLARGTRLPSAREWRSILFLAVPIFVIDYGLLFWAEQRVTSGIAAVMMAMNPCFTALSEIVLLRTIRLTLRLSTALLIGLAGVAVLVSRSLNLGGAPIDRGGAIGLLIASISWSVASVLMVKLPLPAAKGMSSGAQMLAGGTMLVIASAAFGELRNFHPSAVSTGTWLALAYLIFFGSILAFTVYIWLIHRESPTKVGTFAYVNPVVAVVLGYFAGGETLDQRTIVGTLFVIASVIIIVTTRGARASLPAVAGRPGR
ncbi:MAG TPA: EamA family transporter [Thermoanaerobaculia bacterium]|nr:EamA family transporter [Thermoanaerobaculia bacterium]